MRPGQSPTPGQQMVLNRILAVTKDARASGRGRTVFVAGVAGAGRTQTLAFARERLADGGGDVRVAFVRPASAVPADATVPVAGAAGTTTSAIVRDAAVIAATRLGGSLVGLLRDLAQLSASAMRLLSERGDLPLDQVLADALRVAVADEPGAPLVVLIDDADELSGDWWSELHFVLAQEIAERLPIVLVLAVDGPTRLPETAPPTEPPVIGIARQIVANGVADWTAVVRVDAADLVAMHGAVAPAVLERALAVTDGRIGDLVQLWDDWIRRDAIVTTARLIVPGPRFDEVTTETIPGRLARRVEERLSDRSPPHREATRRALGAAALEGRAFTTTAAAHATNMTEDALCDVLNALSVGEAPILKTLQGGRRRFVESLDWRAARQLLGEREAKQASEAIVSVLLELHEDRPQGIAHVIAPLMRRVGDGEGAAHFEKLCQIASSRTVLRSQAQHLIGMDAADWDPYRRRAAAQALTQATNDLFGSVPVDELLLYASAAGALAETLAPDLRWLLAWALRDEGRCLISLGRTTEARDVLISAERACADGAPRLLGTILLVRAGLEADAQNDEHRLARELLARAQAIYTSVGDLHGMASCCFDAASMALTDGEDDEGLALAERSRELFRRCGSVDSYWSATHLLADAELEVGDATRGRELLEATLSYKQEIGHLHDVAACLRSLARADLDVGELTTARQRAIAALAITNKLGFREAEAGLLVTLADIEFGLGDVAAAVASAARAHRFFVDNGEQRSATIAEQQIAHFRSSGSQDKR